MFKMRITEKVNVLQVFLKLYMYLEKETLLLEFRVSAENRILPS